MKTKSKVLIVATVYSHIAQFHQPLIDMLKEHNFEVHICGKNNLALKNGLKINNVDKYYDIDFSRSPISLKNIKAYKILKKIMIENKYDIIHCNTPVGGVIPRLIKRNNTTIDSRIIYTAHGFHFFKGASLKNWLLYYPIEKILSENTDTLITINKEDYSLAQRKFKKCNDIRYVHGVGIDSKKFGINMRENELKQFKENLGLNESDFVLCYVAEQIKRKNQIMAISAMEKIVKTNKNIKLLLVGNGILEEKYKKIIQKKDLEQNVFFLGYRRDIASIMKITDVYISTSTQEGLPVNIMEALCSQLPIIATNCRGNSDLITNGENGYLVSINDLDEFNKCIFRLYSDQNLRRNFSNFSQKHIEPFLVENVINEMKDIYFN